MNARGHVPAQCLVEQTQETPAEYTNARNQWRNKSLARKKADRRPQKASNEVISAVAFGARQLAGIHKL